ncbi:MAG: gliding motility protein GldN [Paramuribaculum sp.]|nr:gliding motility protein GldN [Paramuribaculum sp.]
MLKFKRYILAVTAIVAFAIASVAQDSGSSSSSVMRRGARQGRGEPAAQTGVTGRMQNFYQENSASDADLEWMKVIYRRIDLNQAPNTPLYFPDEPIEGQDNLFRLIMRLVASGDMPVYEYLDGREIFTDQYQVKVRDMLDRFHVYYTDAKGSTEKRPKFDIDPSDVPANEVLSYYVIERWEFDRRKNRMEKRIEAICPVLHRDGDFGGEAVKYPMFWIKYSDLRPYLSTQNIFVDDDNNLAVYTFDDYFQLGLYDGEIYKTRNLRNKSMAQLYPDPDDLKRAQDSIQNHLDNFEKKLWVPSLAEIAAQREAREAAEAKAAEDAALAEAEAAAEAGEEVAETKPAVRSARSARASRSSAARSAKPAAKKKETKTKTPKVKKPKSVSSSSSATRSVRNRKR